MIFCRQFCPRHSRFWQRESGRLAEDTGKVGKLPPIWNVRVARAILPRTSSGIVQSLPVPFQQFALATQDQFTGALG